MIAIGKREDRDRRRARGIGPRSYSSAAQLLRGQALGAGEAKEARPRNPLCEKCGALAQEVHHRVPLAAGGDPYALDGLDELLCKPRHRRTTRRETLGR